MKGINYLLIYGGFMRCMMRWGFVSYNPHLLLSMSGHRQQGALLVTWNINRID